MYEISIIVPIYNVEEYLDECLSSLCYQENIDLQVICIDDASLDNSIKIAESYIGRIKNLEIYSNEINKGLAYSRNKGMKYAQGEYIFFLDSDDYIEKNILREIYEYAKQYNLDILPYNIKMFADTKDVISFNENKRIRSHTYKTVDTGLNMMTQFIENKEICSTATGSIYKRSFIEKERIQFISGILHEDIPFTFESLLKAERVGCLHKNVYYYRQRKDSILHKPNYRNLLRGLVIGYKRMQELITNEQINCNKCNLEAINKYWDSIKWMIKDNYLIQVSRGDIIDKEIEKYIRNNDFFRDESLRDYFLHEDLQRILQTHKITIYGAGSIARFIIYLLKKENIMVSCILVNDKKHNPSAVFDIPVLKWGKEVKDSELIVIAVSKLKQKEIIKEFRNCGVKNYIATIAV